MQRTPRVLYPWRFVLLILPRFLRDCKCGVFRCGGGSTGSSERQGQQKNSHSLLQKNDRHTGTAAVFPLPPSVDFFTASGLAGDGQP